jgi:lipopolysaccharide transport system permease protein
VPWLLLPVVLVLFVGFCFGIALVLSVVTVFFRDVTQVVALVVQFWFWLTPVVYDAAALGPRLTEVMQWNPVTPFILGVRGLLVEGAFPSAWAWLSMVGWAVSLSLAGGLMIRRLRSDLRDAL